MAVVSFIEELRFCGDLFLLTSLISEVVQFSPEVQPHCGSLELKGRKLQL